MQIIFAHPADTTMTAVAAVVVASIPSMHRCSLSAVGDVHWRCCSTGVVYAATQPRSEVRREFLGYIYRCGPVLHSTDRKCFPVDDWFKGGVGGGGEREKMEEASAAKGGDPDRAEITTQLVGGGTRV